MQLLDQVYHSEIWFQIKIRRTNFSKSNRVTQNLKLKKRKMFVVNDRIMHIDSNL